MSPKLDPAVLKALSLDETKTEISTSGGSNFASISKILTTIDGQKHAFFMKASQGKDAEIMFRGEHASLNALHDAVPFLCPRSLANGLLSNGSGSYLVTEFLDMKTASLASTKGGSGLSLGAKLAKVHSTPAPVPEGFETPMFGFPVPTCCGSTEQPNSYKKSWAEFYADNRLLAILKACESSNGSDKELRNTVEETATKVVPRLLGDGHLGGSKGVVPVVVHGDLWSGNKGRGTIGGIGGVEEVVFDPSSCYAHSEYEHGIMRLFGGFGKSFWDEYWKTMEKTEPKEEYDDRVDLYEIYHNLNHYAIFGGGYRSGAMSAMKRLNRKYGKQGPQARIIPQGNSI